MRYSIRLAIPNGAVQVSQRLVSRTAAAVIAEAAELIREFASARGVSPLAVDYAVSSS